MPESSLVPTERDILSNKQARRLEQDQYISWLIQSDLSHARCYFELARYSTRRHEKGEMIAGAVVGFVSGIVFGGGAWMGSLLVGVAGFFATVLLIFLWNWLRAPSAFYKQALAEANSTKLLLAEERARNAVAQLSFEIDEVQVRREGGTVARHIVAQVRLRCHKTVERPMAIRDFHAAIIRDGNPEQIIVPQESSVIALSGQDLPTGTFSGWTISVPLTPIHSFIFYLDVTPEQEQALSREHFIRFTMVAGGQQPISIDVDVNDWQHARDGISYTTTRQ